MSRIRDDPSCVQRVIEADGTIAGTIGSFIIDDQTEVTCWIDRIGVDRAFARGRGEEIEETILRLD